MGSDEGETWGTEANLKCHLIVEVQNGEDAAVHILRAAQLKEYTELICKAVYTHVHIRTSELKDDALNYT